MHMPLVTVALDEAEIRWLLLSGSPLLRVCLPWLRVSSTIHTLRSGLQKLSTGLDIQTGLKEVTEVRRGRQGGCCSSLTGIPVRRGDWDADTQGQPREDTVQTAVGTPGRGPRNQPCDTLVSDGQPPGQDDERLLFKPPNVTLREGA